MPAMGFQTQVNIQPAPGLPGDFASANPRHSVLAGPTQLVAGPSGLTVGCFAWIDATGTYASNAGAGLPAGLVHRELGAAVITTYLAETSNTIPPGFEVTVFNAGDFWVANAGANQVTIGMKAFANFGDGTVTFGAAGSAPALATGASLTGSIAPATSSFTGSIAGNVLTVTAVGTGSIVPGEALSGTGVTAGTTITGQTSGTPFGAGAYTVSIPQTVASETITSTYGILTVTAVASGSIVVGDVLSGSGVTAGTFVTAFGTGTGALGTYDVSATQTAASTAITDGGAVETRWIAMSLGGPGEVIKISNTPQG